MTKVICDKCGREILPPEKTRKVKCKLYYMRFDVFGESVDDPTVKCDLCPACTRELFPWLGKFERRTRNENRNPDSRGKDGW